MWYNNREISTGGKTMIKLEMELSDIDYEVLVKEILNSGLQ